MTVTYACGDQLRTVINNRFLWHRNSDKNIPKISQIMTLDTFNMRKRDLESHKRMEWSPKPKIKVRRFLQKLHLCPTPQNLFDVEIPVIEGLRYGIHYMCWLHLVNDYSSAAGYTRHIAFMTVSEESAVELILKLS